MDEPDRKYIVRIYFDSMANPIHLKGVRTWRFEGPDAEPRKYLTVFMENGTASFYQNWIAVITAVMETEAK